MNTELNGGMKKTILHIVISFDTGGLERFVLDLIRLSTKHFDHKVVCLERTGDLLTLGHRDDTVCLDMKPGLQFKPIAELCSIIKKERADIVHTHNEKALFYGAISGFICGVPVVHTKHGKNQVTMQARLRNHLLARLCKKVIAVSRDAAIQCIEKEYIPSNKVIVILNGVDIETFTKMGEGELCSKMPRINEGVIVLGIVARLAEVKDHATLFQACRILCEREIDFVLMVVGDGPLKDKLEIFTDSLGLSKKILFLGARRDIPDLMNVMDIFALSSISEGISLTLIEAMACRLPIVTTNVGGNPEVVLEGKTGFLVPPQNAEALADKLEILIKKPELRKRMGDAGRDRAVKNFSMQQAVHNYEMCYRNILGG
jgi:sugar transferase (PEP-CTERM/EpsH1 system associated)